MKHKITVIITNFNGLKIIKKSLPQVIKYSTIAEEIIFTDDCSTDNSLKYVRKIAKKYPKIKIISHPRNIGFAKNSNYAANKAKGNLLAFLNSDIYPQKNYLKNCMKHFDRPEVFGVGMCEVGNENWAKIFWKKGYFQYLPGKPVNKPHISGWLSGGSSMIRKDLFQKLGGFDAVYEPFYSEDVDLGYRAWKSGYKLIWEPSAKVIHKHESTISKFPRHFLNYVKERNRLIVVLRNITDKHLLFKNKIFSFIRCLWGPNYIKIIRAAKKQIKKYPSPVVFPKLSDRQIFDIFSR